MSKKNKKTEQQYYNSAIEAYRNKDVSMLTRNMGNLKESDSIKRLRTHMYENTDFSPDYILDNNGILDNIKAYTENATKLNDFNNAETNIFKGIDPELDKMIKADLTDEVNAGKKYIDKIKGNILNSEGKISNYSAYGDLVNQIKEGVGKHSEETIYSTINNFIGNNEMKTPTTKDMSKFIQKTFKGDSTKAEDVTAYMDSIKDYLPFSVSNDEELLNQFQSIVTGDGNKLKKINQISNNQKAKIIEKEKRQLDSFILEPDIKKAKQQKKAKKKATKIAKKQDKKALATLRKSTGTEGGTITEFLRGKGSKGSLFNVGINAIMTVSEFKEGRNEGKTILGSAADAALSFVGMELVGPLGALAIGGAKLAGSLAVKAGKYTIDSSRSMNNVQKFSPFADAQFQDTQQLATMRQSGMELAKMSQYNLQQTLMGTEARSLHR